MYTLGKILNCCERLENRVISTSAAVTKAVSKIKERLAFDRIHRRAMEFHEAGYFVDGVVLLTDTKLAALAASEFGFPTIDGGLHFTRYVRDYVDHLNKPSVPARVVGAEKMSNGYYVVLETDGGEQQRLEDQAYSLLTRLFDKAYPKAKLSFGFLKAIKGQKVPYVMVFGNDEVIGAIMPIVEMKKTSLVVSDQVAPHQLAATLKAIKGRTVEVREAGRDLVQLTGEGIFISLAYARKTCRMKIIARVREDMVEQTIFVQGTKAECVAIGKALAKSYAGHNYGEPCFATTRGEAALAAKGNGPAVTEIYE